MTWPRYSDLPYGSTFYYRGLECVKLHRGYATVGEDPAVQYGATGHYHMISDVRVRVTMRRRPALFDHAKASR